MCCKVSLFQKPVRVTGATLSIGILLQMDYTWANAQTSAEQYGPMGRVDRRNSLRTLVGLHRCNPLGKDKSVASAKCKNRCVTGMWWDHVGGGLCWRQSKLKFWVLLVGNFLKFLIDIIDFGAASCEYLCPCDLVCLLHPMIQANPRPGKVEESRFGKASSTAAQLGIESKNGRRNGADTVQKAERWKDSDLGKWRVDIA